MSKMVPICYEVNVYIVLNVASIRNIKGHLILVDILYIIKKIYILYLPFTTTD